jgi:hypothetical protein
MGIKTMKINNERIGLNLNPKHKIENQIRTQKLK